MNFFAMLQLPPASQKIGIKLKKDENFNVVNPLIRMISN